jgi:uncharacterized protein YciI
MAHELEIFPNNFKKGDRVQHLRSGQFATVTQDMDADTIMVWIAWDKNPSGVAESYMAEAFRVAPWHEINAVEIIERKVADADKDAVRYRKTVTTVFTNGQSTVEYRDTVAEADLHADRVYEHQRLTNIAMSGPAGRIDSIIQGTEALVVVYDTGLTKVFNWVAMP